MRLLLDAGADLNAQEPCGATPLWMAVKKGHAEAAEMLLEAGAPMGMTCDCDTVKNKPLSLIEGARKFSTPEVIDVIERFAARKTAQVELEALLDQIDETQALDEQRRKAKAERKRIRKQKAKDRERAAAEAKAAEQRAKAEAKALRELEEKKQREAEERAMAEERARVDAAEAARLAAKQKAQEERKNVLLDRLEAATKSRHIANLKKIMEDAQEQKCKMVAKTAKKRLKNLEVRISLDSCALANPVFFTLSMIMFE
jgi:flagellar biosynthesis GTPase FlhF